MKKLIFIALTLSLFSCSLYESEGRKELREKGENYQLSSLGTVDNCFLTTDSISQSYTEFIDNELSILETDQHDYYFINSNESYIIACEKLNSKAMDTSFYERYQNDKESFWSWAHNITTTAVISKEALL